MLTFFIMHMFAWVGFIHQNVLAYVLRHQNIVTYTRKKNIFVYKWICLSMCILIY